MISAVDELLSDPARARELGQAGQEMFKRNFSIENYRQHLVEWFNTLV
jgi:hypothetical protein